jgi:hypothetical protein
MKKLTLFISATALLVALISPASASLVTLDFTSLFAGKTAGDQGTTLSLPGLTITAKTSMGTLVNYPNPWLTTTAGGVPGKVYWGDLGMLGTTASTFPVAPSSNYFGLGVLAAGDTANNLTGPIILKEALVFDFAQPQDPKNAVFFGQTQSSTDLSFTMLGVNRLTSGGTGFPADNVRVFLKLASGTVLPFDINAGAVPNDSVQWNSWIRWALNQGNYGDEHIVGLAVEQTYGSATSIRQFGFGSLTYENGDTPVPIPPSLLLLGSGLLGLVGWRRFRKG